MNDISIEQILKVNPPKYAMPLKILMIVLSVLSVVLIPSIMAIGVLLTVGLIAFTVIMFRYYDYEYEYSLVEKELTVDRITAKSSRRRCGVYDVAKLAVMAPAGSEKLESYERQNCKSYNYSSNTDPSATYVLFIPSNKEMVRVILEPNEAMKQAIWEMGPSKVTL